MKIGFNVTNPESYKIAIQLAKSGTIDFVEILLDNFIHLDPFQMVEKLEGLNVGFHIMKSEFIERDLSELKILSSIIRNFSAALRPLYISDHLARFNIHTLNIPITAEIDYDLEYSKVKRKTQTWQDLLGTQLLLENFPSRSPSNSRNQVDFINALISETKCGLLFDLSNAVVADLNHAVSISKWFALKSHIQHLHVGGYRTIGLDESEKWVIDSHDGQISTETISFSQTFFQDFKAHSIVIERDSNLNFDSISADINLIRNSEKLIYA